MKRISYLVLTLFSLHASLFTLHAQAKLENGMDADVVIGNPDFNRSTNDITAQSTAQLVDAWVHNGKLFIAEWGANRMLIYNEVPTENYAAADVVLGQPDFETQTFPLLSQSRFNHPISVQVAENRLLMSEFGNRRILIWNSIPTTNQAPADVVIGQPNFTDNTARTTQQGMGQGTGFHYANGKLFVADFDNHRVLMFSGIPTTNFAAADLVLGQPDFVTATAGTTANIMNNPQSAWSDGKILIVVERTNRRALIYNKIPTRNFQAADVVVGQPDFVTNSFGTTRSKMGGPQDLFSDGERLFISDTSNHRVLIWNKIPTTNGAPADYVLGQDNFTSGAAAHAANRMDNPVGLFADGQRLFVAGFNLGRVLIFNYLDKGDIELGPQFSQGKAVVGKVYWDWNANRQQDAGGAS